MLSMKNPFSIGLPPRATTVLRSSLRPAPAGTVRNVRPKSPIVPASVVSCVPVSVNALAGWDSLRRGSWPTTLTCSSILSGSASSLTTTDVISPFRTSICRTSPGLYPSASMTRSRLPAGTGASTNAPCASVVALSASPATRTEAPGTGRSDARSSTRPERLPCWRASARSADA